MGLSTSATNPRIIVLVRPKALGRAPDRPFEHPSRRHAVPSAGRRPGGHKRDGSRRFCNRKEGGEAPGVRERPRWHHSAEWPTEPRLGGLASTTAAPSSSTLAAPEPLKSPSRPQNSYRSARRHFLCQPDNFGLTCSGEGALRIVQRVRDKVRAGLTAVGSIPALVPILFDDRVRGILMQLPGAGSLYGDGWHRRHPFDRQNGTDTSGTVLVESIRGAGDHPAFEHAITYAGSQPSVIRAALNALPGVTAARFIDLGCGKGRALLVATEFPFRDIVGVELAEPLARIARANATAFAVRHPNRPRVSVEVADATSFPFPPGDLVIFMFHPFRAAAMSKVVAAVERAIDAEPRAVYVVYDNPIDWALFDASPRLLRRWTRMVPHSRQD